MLAALVGAGHHVLVPFGSHQRYDLVVDLGDEFLRVQCKSGRLAGGAVFFRTHSTTGARLEAYGGEADAFGVFCAALGTVYLVPVEAVPPRGAHLRLEPAKNRQERGVRWADDYLVVEASRKDGGCR